MKLTRFILVTAALLICAPAFSQIKPCEELKSEIDAKLQAKGVTNFTLEIVPADQIKDQKVIGSCDGGKNKITYTRGTAAAKEATATKEETKETKAVKETDKPKETKKEVKVKKVTDEKKP
jgi:hypothetical protein